MTYLGKGNSRPTPQSIYTTYTHQTNNPHHYNSLHVQMTLPYHLHTPNRRQSIHTTISTYRYKNYTHGQNITTSYKTLIKQHVHYFHQTMHNIPPNYIYKETTLPMSTQPKILGVTLDPKLTYNSHIVTNTHKSLHIIKSQLPMVFLPMIGVPDGGRCGRYPYSTSPRSSVHSRDHHRTGSFRRTTHPNGRLFHPPQTLTNFKLHNTQH